MPEIPLVSVIDNSHSMRREMAILIRSSGFDVEVFGSAEEFIRSNQLPSTNSLVINVQLLGMSGLQLQSHLASAGRHIPIIFVNSSSDEKARAQAYEVGAISLLDKTSGHEALLKELNSTLKSQAKGAGRLQPSIAGVRALP